MKFYPEINPEVRIPKNLKHGLDMFVAHCAVTGREQVDFDYVIQFLEQTPYASSAKNFKPNHLMLSFAPSDNPLSHGICDNS